MQHTNLKISKTKKNAVINQILTAAYSVNKKIKDFIADVEQQDDEEEVAYDDDTPEVEQIAAENAISSKKANRSPAETEYDSALNEFLKYRNQFPDIKAELEKRKLEIEKKYVINEHTLTNLKKDTQDNINLLLADAKSVLTLRNTPERLKMNLVNSMDSTIRSNRFPDADLLSHYSYAHDNNGDPQKRFDHDLLTWILEDGKNPKSYISTNPEMQNIFLQLRAFKKIQDAININTNSPIPALIAVDHATKELKNAAHYKSLDKSGKPRAPTRFLHYLSLILLVPIVAATYSYAKYGTMFYATNLEKKQITEKSLNKFQKKTQHLTDKPKPGKQS